MYAARELGRFGRFGGPAVTAALTAAMDIPPPTEALSPSRSPHRGTSRPATTSPPGCKSGSRQDSAHSWLARSTRIAAQSFPPTSRPQLLTALATVTRVV